MNISEIKPKMRVHCYGDVAIVIRVKANGLVAVHFTGRTLDGKFGLLKGGMDALAVNLHPVP